MLNKIDMDNGSLPIAKDSLRILSKTKLSGAHRAIIDVIWLQTYGWHDHNSKHEQKIKQRKTTAQIPHQIFINETWMDKTTISRKITELIEWGIIFRDKHTMPFTYSFNVNVGTWSKFVFRDTTVAHTVNSLQDSQQFNEQSTNSLQDSQLGVDCTVNSLQPETPKGPAIEADLKKELEKDKENITTTNPAVPFKKITDLYHELCPSLPKIVKMPENRKTHVAARWNQYDQDIEIFRTLFMEAEASDLLTHRITSSNPKYENFKADFDWLMIESNMAKTLEGKYRNRAGPGPPGNHNQKGGATSGKHSNLFV